MLYILILTATVVSSEHGRTSMSAFENRVACEAAGKIAVDQAGEGSRSVANWQSFGPLLSYRCVRTDGGNQ